MDQETARPEKGLLRFLTCGSVDDGKSTLIGRLLYDTKLILEDQLAALKRDSRKHGTTGDDIDFALLVDGLEAEREQGITIDVAYRFFSTPRRAFIVADTPGHEQYTRNMATGASNSDAAVILIDARKGVLTQTRRHSYICSLLGIRHVVLAVNKIDLVDFSGERFHHIVGDYLGFAQALAFASITPIPVSARFGDNVTTRSQRMSWYDGPTLLEHLEELDATEGARGQAVPLPGAVGQPPQPRLPRFLRHGGLRRASRPATRGGRRLGTADDRRAHRHGRRRSARGAAGDAVTLTLADEVDVARGDMLARRPRPGRRSSTSSPRTCCG